MRKYSVQEANNIALGQLGFDELTIPALGSATVTGNWVAIKAVGGDADISEILTSVGDDIPTTTGLSLYQLEAGETLYAPITSITPVSIKDKLIAYRR